MGKIRMTYATGMVLQALDAGYRYGFDIAQAARLRPGSVYQILHRLEEAGLAEARWEDAERARAEGRPSRRYYRLAGEAAELVAEAGRCFPTLERLDGDPAAEGGTP